MRLNILESTTLSPEYNLELEKFLSNYVDDHSYLLRFWHNSPSIIMGRFQDAEFEVNNDFANQSGIPIVKRHTGGGTVYHDEGTLNVTLIKKKNPLMHPDHKKDSDFLALILTNAFIKLGFDINKNERNSLFIGQEKILGSAVSLTGNIFCFHASILVNTNLENLKKAINWNPLYYNKKRPYVKSHRSPVVNLSTHNPQIDITTIKKTIANSLLEMLPHFDTVFLDEKNIKMNK